MFSVRHLILGANQGRILMNRTFPSGRIMQRMHHDHELRPFDNMPFKVTNRYICTFVFCIMFGPGWWAPYAILWYSMAKRTM